MAQTVLSLFQTEEDVCAEDGLLSSGDEGRLVLPLQRQHPGFFSRAAWKRYFRPMTRKVYYKPVFHLAVVNFPYALAAWVYLFVFTVVRILNLNTSGPFSSYLQAGTTLLVALPLGAVLCFFNLLGARAFSRGELALQTKFHAPLAHPAPYPPRTLFTRYREPTVDEIESRRVQLSRGGLVREKSFYRNTYAMVSFRITQDLHHTDKMVH